MDVDAPTSAVATSLSPQQAGGEADVSASQADEPCVCPICRGAFSDPFVAPCGHSFCHNCINTHLATRANCPACGAFAATERLVPNYALSLLAGKVGAAKAAAELDPAARLQNALAGNELRDINEVRGGQAAGRQQTTWDRLRGCAGKGTRPDSCTPPLSGSLRHPE